MQVKSSSSIPRYIVPKQAEGALLTPSCPHCWHSQGKWLQFTSSLNDVNYFQCMACGHVWTAPKKIEARQAPPEKEPT